MDFLPCLEGHSMDLLPGLNKRSTHKLTYNRVTYQNTLSIDYIGGSQSLLSKEEFMNYCNEAFSYRIIMGSNS